MKKARPYRTWFSTFGRGFTLIEMIVAVTLFIVVMTISMGSILNVFDANRKSRSLKNALSGLNFAIESMSKEIRFGKNYHCGGGTITVPQDCPSGDIFFSFLSSDGEQIVYRLNNGLLEKQTAGGPYIRVTGSELFIDNLKFYTTGAGVAGDAAQPKVIILLKSHAGSGKGRTDLSLETVVSQRVLDI